MRQRNTQQIKEQDKCPPKQTKEEETINAGEDMDKREPSYTVGGNNAN